MNYSLKKYQVLKNKEDTGYFTVTELDGLDRNKVYSHEVTNFNFAIGVYPKRFGYFLDNIEDFIDVKVRISPGRVNEVDEINELGLHRCN